MLGKNPGFTRHASFKKDFSIMRIGIDGHVLGKNIGGVERFVYELVQHLPNIAAEHQYIVFVTKAQYAKLQASSVPIPPNVQFKPLLLSNPLLERLLVLPWLVYQHKLDALLIQRLAPWFCGSCKLIVTIHDLTPIKLAHAYKGLSNVLVRLLTKSSILRASLILTPTSTIKSEIQAYCPTASMPIVPFYNGVDISKFHQTELSNNQPALVAKPYLLTVGAIEQRKNIETMLGAMALMPSSDLKLVILGSIRAPHYHAEMLQLVTTLQLQDRVKWIRFIEEDGLVNLYRNATLFIAASRDEGFNLPPLEAMACATPVLCSDIAVHRELFEGAATFFATESAEDLVQKINERLQNNTETHALTEAALERAKFYNWTQTTRNVADAIKRIV
jgi:glycosyltransferase involved in cell wall biosynthesis